MIASPSTRRDFQVVAERSQVRVESPHLDPRPVQALILAAGGRDPATLFIQGADDLAYAWLERGSASRLLRGRQRRGFVAGEPLLAADLEQLCCVLDHGGDAEAALPGVVSATFL